MNMLPAIITTELGFGHRGPSASGRTFSLRRRPNTRWSAGCPGCTWPATAARASAWTTNSRSWCRSLGTTRSSPCSGSGRMNNPPLPYMY
eukprot:1179465-Prorocentrum_minimum.AAC.7